MDIEAVAGHLVGHVTIVAEALTQAATISISDTLPVGFADARDDLRIDECTGLNTKLALDADVEILHLAAEANIRMVTKQSFHERGA